MDGKLCVTDIGSKPLQELARRETPERIRCVFVLLCSIEFTACESKDQCDLFDGICHGVFGERHVSCEYVRRRRFAGTNLALDPDE